ncbi:hypothetical protein Salat_0245000 [Sesamum alatum]|uniref:Uncharacterized protein n=1 Tax=Sesamum alatum TaxID=300844 RepID=A0AAE1YZQ6_9LAMI|nr:hypothetical protein Salat_0245000 [Sesamum alatum]
MILLRTIRNLHSRAVLDLRSPSNSLKNPLLTSLISSNSIEFSFLWSINQRPFSLAAQFAKESEEEKTRQFVKPLSVIYKEAVGLSGRTENSAVEAEDHSENAELKQKLRKLEEEMRRLNKKSSEIKETSKLHTENGDLVERSGAKRSLWELFSDKKTEDLKPTDCGTEDPMVHKELSSDMQMFAQHLYMEGYLKDATFLRKNKFDVTQFESSYARNFLKYAAGKFGRDHQQIAKWLSASDLKRIALFGCPSLGRKSIYASKHMRRFFGIEEHKVCQKCVLKESCEHANKKYWKESKKLLLGCVTRVVVTYAMGSVPQQLVVPEEIKNSASRLLKEIINLSETVS